MNYLSRSIRFFLVFLILISFSATASMEEGVTESSEDIKKLEKKMETLQSELKSLEKKVAALKTEEKKTFHLYEIKTDYEYF